MKRFYRQRGQSEDEESVFVPMTDMTVSFLFIVMILLAFFATQISTDDLVPLEEYEKVRDERDVANEKAKQLDAQLKNTLEQLAELRQRNRQLAKLLDEFREQLDNLSNSHDNLLIENRESNEEIEDLERKIKDLEDEKHDLEVLLDEVRSLLENLRKQLEKKREINPLEAYFATAIQKRYEILKELQKRLLIEFPDLEVVISPEQDALRFQGEGLFRSESHEFQAEQREIVETIGNLLDDILGCYTLGTRAERGSNCNSGLALIEAVQIEGHTDSDGEDTYNLNLSTLRAISTFQVIWETREAILSHVNIRNQPVLSVSGYGEMRPVATNLTVEGKSTNRRIDLRFIMYAPSDIDELNELGRRISELPNRSDNNENQ